MEKQTNFTTPTLSPNTLRFLNTPIPNAFAGVLTEDDEFSQYNTFPHYTQMCFITRNLLCGYVFEIISADEYRETIQHLYTIFNDFAYIDSTNFQKLQHSLQLHITRNDNIINAETTQFLNDSVLTIIDSRYADSQTALIAVLQTLMHILKTKNSVQHTLDSRIAAFFEGMGYTHQRGGNTGLKETKSYIQLQQLAKLQLQLSMEKFALKPRIEPVERSFLKHLHNTFVNIELTSPIQHKNVVPTTITQLLGFVCYSEKYNLEWAQALYEWNQEEAEQLLLQKFNQYQQLHST